MYIGGMVIAGLGLILIFVGLAASVGAIRLWRSGVFATGRIVSTRPLPGDLVALQANVAFTTPSGRNVEFKSAEKCKLSDVGMEVEVCYLPSDPEMAEMAKHAGFKGVMNQLGVALIGLLMVAGGAGAFFLKYFLRHMDQFVR